MNQNTIVIVLVAFLLGGIGGYALNISSNGHEERGMMTHTADTNETMTTQRMPDNSTMNNSNGNDMDHMMNMMVASEQEFLVGMIPHHQEAVDTAKEVIARGGTTPEIRQLAEDIVVAQEREITAMKQWYQDWYGVAYVDDGGYTPMMRDLGQLSGVALDRTFLEDMIMHHMGAIMMARSVQPHIEHSEIETLTQAIVITQSEEIRLMRRLLEEL